MATIQHPLISIVIPVADEAAALPDCLGRIDRTSTEIIVVDAGSQDETSALARAAGCAGARPRRSATGPGR